MTYEIPTCFTARSLISRLTRAKIALDAESAVHAIHLTNESFTKSSGISVRTVAPVVVSLTGASVQTGTPGFLRAFGKQK